MRTDGGAGGIEIGAGDPRAGGEIAVERIGKALGQRGSRRRGVGRADQPVAAVIGIGPAVIGRRRSDGGDMTDGIAGIGVVDQRCVGAFLGPQAFQPAAIEIIGEGCRHRVGIADRLGLAVELIAGGGHIARHRQQLSFEVIGPFAGAGADRQCRGQVRIIGLVDHQFRGRFIGRFFGMGDAGAGCVSDPRPGGQIAVEPYISKALSRTPGKLVNLTFSLPNSNFVFFPHLVIFPIEQHPA